MKRCKSVACVMGGVAAMVIVGVVLSALAQEPPPARAKALPVGLTKARPKFPDLPPTPPDWEFVQTTAISRFPGANVTNVMRFATENCPTRVRSIRALCKIRPDEAVEALTDLAYEMTAIMALRETQPALYESKIRQLKIDAEVERWVEASRQNQGDVRQKDLDALRRALEQAFDVRQDLMKSEVEQLEKKLQELKTLVQKRQENRSVLIARRFAELSGEEKPLKW